MTVGHYHYEPGEDDKLISELVIPYTEQSYKAMLAEVNKYFIGEYKKIPLSSLSGLFLFSDYGCGCLTY